MTGRLIFVSGLSGAGKTTLIRAALDELSNLHYLKTVTTRRPRVDEGESFEYQFVSDGEYDELRAKSANWDHTDYQGNKYGADIDDINSLLIAGEKVICSIAPDATVADSMSELYGTKPIVLWVDTNPEIAKARVDNDSLRSGRDESDDFKNNVDYVFKPTGHLEVDKKNFVELLKRF